MEGETCSKINRGNSLKAIAKWREYKGLSKITMAEGIYPK
jgi:hypothetical protein